MKTAAGDKAAASWDQEVLIELILAGILLVEILHAAHELARWPHSREDLRRRINLAKMSGVFLLHRLVEKAADPKRSGQRSIFIENHHGGAGCAQQNTQRVQGFCKPAAVNGGIIELVNNLIRLRRIKTRHYSPPRKK